MRVQFFATDLHGQAQTNTDNGSVHKAMEQIKKMKFYEKYLGSRKEIILPGTGFDAAWRNIGNYLLEYLPGASTQKGE